MSITFGAVTLAGAAFMIGFLLALLRESAQSTNFDALRPKLKRTNFQHLGNSYVHGNYAEENKVRNDYVEFLESDIYAKGSSGPITVAILSNTGTFSRRPKLFGRVGIFQKHQFLD